MSPTQHCRDTGITDALIPNDLMAPASKLYPPLEDGVTQLAPAPGWAQRQLLVLTPLQLAGLDPMPTHDKQADITPRYSTVHHADSVCIFTGNGDIKVEDWVSDMRHTLYSLPPRPPCDQFDEIVRHMEGNARELILNLAHRGEEHRTPAAAFQELLEEYGDEVLTLPMTNFYARVQQPNESPSEYAIALEATLRIARDQHGEAGTVCKEAYDAILCTQFIHGLQNQRVHACLTSMHPLQMTFKRLRRELRVIEAAERLNIAPVENQAADEQTNSLDQQAADRTVAAQHCQKQNKLAGRVESDMRPDILRTPEGGIRIFRPPRIDTRNLAHAQRTHTAIRRVTDLVTGGQKPDVQQCARESRLVQRFLRNWNRLELEEGILVFRPSGKNGQALPILPKRYRYQVFKSIHRQMGPITFNMTICLLKSQCYWPSLAAEIRSYAKRCGSRTAVTPSDSQEFHGDETRNSPCDEAVNGRMATARRASETFPSGSAQDRDSYHEDDIHSLESEQQGAYYPKRCRNPPVRLGSFW